MKTINMKHNNYVMVFNNVRIPSLKNRTFVGYFYSLVRRLSYIENIVQTYKHGYPTSANIQDIADMLKISYTYTEKFLVNCVKEKAMVRIKFGKSTNYIVNPAYAFNGSDMSISMYEHFGESLDFLLTLKAEDKIKIREVYGDDVDLKISIELGRSYVDRDGNTQYNAITPSDLIKIKKQNMIDNCKRN